MNGNGGAGRTASIIAASALALLASATVSAGEGGDAQAKADLDAARAAERHFTRLAARLHESVVTIDIVRSPETALEYASASLLEPWNAPRDPGRGSGMAISEDGQILTAEHVVRDALKLFVILPGGERIEGKVLAVDRRSDMAVVKIDPPAKLKPVAFGDSGSLAVGQTVCAMGSPRGFEGSFSAGRVSGLDRALSALPHEGAHYLGMVQTDATLNKGNSGGPLTDIEGRVIGMNAVVVAESGGSEGLGFAVPARVIRHHLEYLAQGKPVVHGWIGVQYRPIDRDLIKEAAAGVTQGVLVDAVVPGSPAAKAGLAEEMVIIKVNGAAVSSFGDAILAVDLAKAGEKIKFTVRLEGKESEVTVEVGTRDQGKDLVKKKKAAEKETKKPKKGPEKTPEKDTEEKKPEKTEEPEKAKGTEKN
jgi:serine protease Do